MEDDGILPILKINGIALPRKLLYYADNNPGKVMFAPKRIICLALILVPLGLGPAPHTGLAVAQWSPPVRISEPGGCSYPHILAQGDTLHVVYTNSRGGEKISYVKSTDRGENWTPARVLSDTINSGSTRYAHTLRWGAGLLEVWRMAFYHGIYTDNIAYRISSDNGATWNVEEYVLNPNWEHPFFMTADGADSLVNLMMSSWTGDSAAFFSIRSTNFGQTWSMPRRIFNAYDSGRSDITFSDSLVHFSWGGKFDSRLHWETYYVRSTDAGVTWSNNVPLSEVDQHHSYDPAICTNGSGGVELTWMDFKYAPPGFTGDIFFRHSTDRGMSWSPEVQITDRHKSTLSDIVSVAETLYVVWQDERPENGHFSIYFSQSTDGGQTWSEEYRLDGDSLESRQPALAASNGAVYAVWAETRYSPDTSGLYFSRWPLEPDAVEEENEIVKPEMIYLTVYPNPFNSSTFITYSGLTEKGELGIYDIQGHLVRSIKLEGKKGKTEWDGTDAAGKSVASGIYLARLLSGDHSREIKLIYLK